MIYQARVEAAHRDSAYEQFQKVHARPPVTYSSPCLVSSTFFPGHMTCAARPLSLVQRIDCLLKLPLHGGAAHLHGGRHLVVVLIELLGEDGEPPDLLHPCQLLIHRVHLFLDKPVHLHVLGQAPVGGVGDTVFLGPVGHVVQLELYQGREVRPAVTHHDPLLDERAELELVLDLAGRDILPVCVDYEILFPVNYIVVAIFIGFQKISGKKPGEFITKKGEPMVYGITVLKNAPNKKAAMKFVEFLLDKEKGIKIMEKNGQPSAVPMPTSSYDKIPKELKKFAMKGGDK